jgi:FAD:protein FMN transferase
MRNAIIILGFLGMGSAGQEPQLHRQEFTRPLMGTQARIVLYHQDEAHGKKAAGAAFDRLEGLNRILSDYLEESELSKLSRGAGGPPVPVSAELFEVLAYAQEVATRSDGAFDVTVGPLTQLWRRSRRQKQLPDAATLEKAKAKVGYRSLKLDAAQRTAQLLQPGMRLDLGGIAKGYAADEAIRVLKQKGVTQALVAIGGDIVVSDAPPGQKGWVIQIAPLGTEAPIPALLLSNAGVSTAGDAEQFVEIDGKRYSHIVDPKTGLGLRHRSSVTVVAPCGLVSDALDTAATVLGPDRGLELIEAIPGAAASLTYLLLSGERKEVQSRRWALLPRQPN